MAERRMFAKTIIDSDAFLDMPLSTQALYFHLSMRADDDGFLNNAKKIMRTIGANSNDYDLLLAKGFIIQMEDGICVIKHWRIHNYIQRDRYKPTVYQEEMSRLAIKENNAYTLMDTECIQDGYSLETQVRLGKDSIGKERLGEVSQELGKETITSVLNSYAPVGTDLHSALVSFKEMRSKMKKPLTVRALKMALKELDNLSAGDEITKTAIVDQSLERGWQKFYELKINNSFNNKGITDDNSNKAFSDMADFLEGIE